MRELLQQLQEQVVNQQGEIDQLQNALEQNQENSHAKSGSGSANVEGEELSKINDDDYGIIKSFAVIKEVIDIELREGISGLSIKGDVRYRYEHQKVDIASGESTENRQRVRLRIGATWTNPDEEWEFRAGLVTGGEDATSSNATFSDGSVF